MFDLPHPHALSGYAAVSADGGARPHPTLRLDALRHRPCRLSAEAYDSRGTGAGIRVDLPATLLACIHLEKAAGRLASDSAVSGNVLPLQTIQPLLAPADQTRSGEPGLEASGGDNAPAARAIPEKTGPTGGGRWISRADCFGRSLKTGELFSERSRPALVLFGQACVRS